MITLRTILVFLPLVACGGSVADAIDSGSADGGADSARDVALDSTPIFECPATTPGTQIYGFCLDSITIEDKGGGLAPAPPPGSECNGGELHTVDLKTKATHEERCLILGPNQPYKLQKLDRTLPTPEYDALIAALTAARVASPGGCGADGSLVQLTVRSNLKKEITYTDVFYSCQGNSPYASGLDAILGAFVAPK